LDSLVLLFLTSDEPGKRIVLWVQQTEHTHGHLGHRHSYRLNKS